MKLIILLVIVCHFQAETQAVRNKEEDNIDFRNIPGFIEEFRRQINANNQNQGSYIRTKVGDKCLDAGFEADNSTYYLYQNGDCPKEARLRWMWSDGSIWVPKESVPKVDQNKGCLDCWGEYANCDVRVVGCHGRYNQNFTIYVHWDAMIEPDTGRFYFGIRAPNNYPFKCLTRYSKEFEKMIEIQRVDEDVYGDSPSLKPLYRRTRYNADIFELQNCDGTADQIFYIEGFNLTWAKAAAKKFETRLV